jgi:DNA mismatch repair ATPase MutS/predicted GIY-YIG superfamily endonuclease
MVCLLARVGGLRITGAASVWRRTVSAPSRSSRLIRERLCTENRCRGRISRGALLYSGRMCATTSDGSSSAAPAGGEFPRPVPDDVTESEEEDELGIWLGVGSSLADEEILNSEKSFSRRVKWLLAAGEIAAYWERELHRVDKPAARRLLPLLDRENPLGFTPGPTMMKKGSLFEYVVQEKRQHPDKVLLVRVGEFFEAWGVDAMLLVQWCGLNAMGGKARAGCPVRNIQQTLDSLTAAGLSVAVYEELDEPAGRAAPRVGRKTRALAQVVTPGSSNYIYGMTLCPGDVAFRESRPYMGIRGTSGGYEVVQVDVDSRRMSVSERLTEEALKAAVEAAGPAEPVFLQNVPSPPPAFLPDHVVRLKGRGSTKFPLLIAAHVRHILQLPKADVGAGGGFLISLAGTLERPRPVYLSTALQVGLLPNPNVPDLVQYLLPQGQVGQSSRWLKRWLLNPPPYDIADATAALCRELQLMDVALPILRPVPVGKVVTMISARQCNAQLFRDIDACLRCILAVMGRESATTNPYEGIVSPMLEVVEYQSGMDASAAALRTRGVRVVRHIAAVVAPEEAVESPTGSNCITSDPHELIPSTFFDRNEGDFRSSVSAECVTMQDPYVRIAYAAQALCLAVHEDFGSSPADVTYDPINNLISLRKLPKEPAVDLDTFKHPLDRNRRTIRNRYTTERVQAALGAYLEAAGLASTRARKALVDLSRKLASDLPIIAQAAHAAVLLQTLEAHVRHACASSWTLPTLQSAPTEGNEQAVTMTVEKLLPYWLPMGQNWTFQLKGIFLLTAPNMGGKSTLMRSTMAAALLANCGLFIPAASASIPRYSSYFLRAASYDVPSEGKSAFALEMDDMRVMLRDSSNGGHGKGTSLVMVDEVGKGTSARDGVALAGALLEAMDSAPVSGVFATHLHEIFDLMGSIRTKRVTEKCMEVVMDTAYDPPQPLWTYRIQDGRCTDSLALHTARTYGIPQGVLERAEELAMVWDGAKATFPARDTSSQEPLGEKQDLSMSDAESIIMKVTGCSEGALIRIPSGYDPPPQLEGQSLLYILHNGGAMYVGETDGIRRRLEQHRASRQGRIDAVALQVANKSKARALETEIINTMQEQGFLLWASGDGGRPKTARSN